MFFIQDRHINIYEVCQIIKALQGGFKDVTHLIMLL